MNLFNIPGLNGLKTVIGSWTQIICGLLLAVVDLLKAVNDCVSGATAFDVCLNTLPVLFMGVIAAANGLANLGLGHKLEKLRNATFGV